MIVFNLWTIPVGIAIYLVLEGLEHFFPALTTGTHFGWTFGIVAAVVGGIFELVGVRGRIFFVPIWLLGVATLCFQLGWPGTLSLAIGVGAGAVVLFRKGVKKERADWDKVQLALIKAPAAPIDGTEAQFWTWVKAMLFLPIWMKLTPDVCDHNLTVIAALKNTKPSFSAREFQTIEVLEEFLKDSKATAKPVDCQMKLQQSVNDLVRKKARRADAKKPFRRELPPPLFARGVMQAPAKGTRAGNQEAELSR
jgi:hypothetical protein